MELLAALVEETRALVAAVAPPRVFAGVPVREVEALDVAVPRPICLVGDLVGDCSENREDQYLELHNYVRNACPHPDNA